ncbi:SDR family oxidoreductase [Salegentibacter salegens]|uniref:NAD(P)-dependent dehydrogenase, short-chain alcohol dehydrogenase family n=1 Tax=Salegentibacter salegens TaxID=143223 RepID=A0A1M7IID9_9FLAO|nr:SDR family oxidoreductase [Salegentibacter salegens]PRX39000.1 NAD(P)-dependent dehydrogenase (short-subunit alcohol dehydrogenase family) [Salegentibacter salegens]SHM40368.1 NAD(P)-dependent dehydrogenase, short-chain alcohol dehydrogenase family [Salegentibacter salegens]
MNNNFSIKNKVIAITGGGGVLGGSMAKYLVQNEAKVIILAHNPKNTEKRVKELNAIMPNSASGYTADVLDEELLAEIATKIIEKEGRLDGLINAAGGNMPGATVNPDQTIFDISTGDLKKVLDLNLMGSVMPSLALGKIMAEQGSGVIINISSMASTQAITRVLGYSMAKSGIEIFTKWMAMEMAMKFNDKIRINALAPGFFIGNQNRKLLINEDGSYTERGKTVIRKTPMKRFGDASELNGTVHYLLSDAASFVTGTIVPVDGGFSSFSGV